MYHVNWVQKQWFVVYINQLKEQRQALFKANVLLFVHDK